MNTKSRQLTRAGISCASYIVLNAIFAPISFGLVQVRVSEALTVLVLLFPECTVGLTLGCVISNLIFSTPLDVVIGGMATLVSSLVAVYLKTKLKSNVAQLIWGEVVIILTNAFAVPLSFITVTDGFVGYLFGASTVFLGEVLSVGVLGSVLYFALIKFNLSKKR